VLLKSKKCYGSSYYSKEENKIITEDIDIDRIKMFWNKNNNGLIEFG